ncbi:hypothetical protein PSTG_05792 [Puccinia striiformis f. sp. tritici PST-78]|uniref:Uncharacterized protein n=1 Tax=Puccinia striiformis f. sp. tritici PST-78 TaxID=1165861 RepID=A0A0L0VPG4_9BASI|nr:hypothetical protein PSTG_05792 [Puccinia striiformis f. sp. tritici PST-78]
MWSKVVEGVTIQGYYVNTTRSVNSEEIVSTPKRPRSPSIDSNSPLLSSSEINRLCTGRSLPTSLLSSPQPEKEGNKASRLNGIPPKRSRQNPSHRSPLTGKTAPQSVIRKAPPNNQRKQRRLTVKQLAANSKGIARSKAPSKDLTKPTASGSRIKDWVCPTGANLDLALQVEARRLDTLAASEALFRNLPAGAFNRLDFWEKTKNKPADPLKNKKISPMLI